MIKTEAYAKEFASHILKKSKVQVETVVVSVSGDVLCNCDVEDVCKEMDLKGEKYFIVMGERLQKNKNVKEENV